MTAAASSPPVAAQTPAHRSSDLVVRRAAAHETRNAALAQATWRYVPQPFAEPTRNETAMAGTGEHSAIAQTGAESEGGKAFPTPRSASADTSNRGVALVRVPTQAGEP